MALSHLAHGGGDRGRAFLGGEAGEAGFGGKLEVDREAVGPAAGLLDQPGAGLGDRLEVDVAGEAVVAAQAAGDAQQLLHGVVGRLHHAGGEKQPFDVVALVELEGEGDDLLDREAGARGVGGAAVDAIGAVVKAPVGQQDLQQRDAAAVGRIGVANAHTAGRAEAGLAARAFRRAGGGAGGVVLGGIGKDAQLRGKLRVHSRCSSYVLDADNPAAVTAALPLDPSLGHQPALGLVRTAGHSMAIAL